jgi:protein O-GlcNAc transferase
MPELIAASEKEYEELACALAIDSERLQRMRDKLARHRQTKSLFDTRELIRNIEHAYRAIWQRHGNGLPLAGISIEQGCAKAPDALHLAAPNDMSD